ncbi:MAG TPA: YrdB family protein [Plantibacter sp.]|uniref:YrdB family protein n=1 Tax=unclassified Plantibacter TaxID=2624265 RepID=UPI002BED2F37|nr:YrdB family protein [Plantibacter sp.]
MSERTPADVKIGPNEILRFFLELFAFFSLGFWGVMAWPFPWNVVIGIAAPLVAIVLWALFLSPRAVIRIDLYGRTVVELVIFGAAALAWWNLGQPVIGAVFAVIAVVSGVVSGRKQIA